MDFRCTLFGPAALIVALAGCPTSDAPAEPTWHQDVAPIVVGSCAGCHRAGGVGPFALQTYEDAAPIAGWLAGVTESGQMPPWGVTDDGCGSLRPLHEDPSLSEAQIQTLRNWADTGAALGDPATAAPLPSGPDWSLTEPTRRLEPDEPYVVRGDEDDFRCVVLDPELASPVWLTGMEVVPDATEVVHHALVWVDSDGASADLADETGGYPCFGGSGFDGGKLVGGWVPGAGALEYPEGSGLEIAAGSRFVVQYHYFGNGTDTPDASALDLRWVEAEPARKVTMALRGNAGSAAGGLQLQPGELAPEFVVPAGAEAHKETIRVPLPGLPNLGLFLVGPHMHLAGVSMKVSVERPGGVRQCLLEADAYDFYWQRLYRYDTPIEDLPILSGADTLILECTYDNTLDNGRIRDALSDEGLAAPVDLSLGDSSLEEMCLAVLGVVR